MVDILASFALGLVLPLINVPLQTKLTRVIPRRIFGKVNAFLNVFMGGGTPAMATVLSIVARYFQVTTILLYIGILLLPTTLSSFIILPRFMRMEVEDEKGESK